MCMDNGDRRIVEREVVAVDAAGEVDILRIHEIALIEQGRAQLGIGTQQHKATAEVRHVERAGRVGCMQLIAGIATAHPRRGQETATEDIKRGGQQFAEMLRRSFGIDHTRHELTDLRVRLHKRAKRIHIGGMQADITIEHQMQRNGIRYAAADSDIMRTAIA